MRHPCAHVLGGQIPQMGKAKGAAFMLRHEVEKYPQIGLVRFDRMGRCFLEHRFMCRPSLERVAQLITEREVTHYDKIWCSCRSSTSAKNSSNLLPLIGWNVSELAEPMTIIAGRRPVPKFNVKQASDRICGALCP